MRAGGYNPSGDGAGDPLNRVRVYLVGAGPGDPGLITLRGLRCLERADVVLYGSLVDQSVLDHAPEQAERIYVGKRTASHTVPQDEINRLMVEHVQAGRVVVRLKGGDPFVFGRGCEEGRVLYQAGIPFEVVPGISFGLAVPAYAGIPVTLRGVTSHCTLATGHEDPLEDTARLDWDNLASDVGTLVIFMGVKNLPNIAANLKERGTPGSTPVALIRHGTLAGQQTVVGTLDDISDRVAAAGLRPPALIVVGDVVRRREELRWFEERPLFGRRVVVTRPRRQAGGQVQLIRELGAQPVLLPTISIEPVLHSEGIDRMLRSLPAYDFLVFTSANGVTSFFDRLQEADLDVRALGKATVAAIGPKTAAACRARGLLPDVVPEEYVAEALLAALGTHRLEGARVLIPRAREAREILPRSLREAGAGVEVVPVYDTQPVEHESARVEEALEADYVTFTSGSTVRNFAGLVRAVAGEEALAAVQAASIGPVTSRVLREEGMEPVVEAGEYTMEGLMAALAAEGLRRVPGEGGGPGG